VRENAGGRGGEAVVWDVEVAIVALIRITERWGGRRGSGVSWNGGERRGGGRWRERGGARLWAEEGSRR